MVWFLLAKNYIIMDKVKNFIKKIKFFIRSQRLRYLPYRKVLFTWISNRQLRYKMISKDEAKKYKRSNIIFVLGSGPSIKRLTKEQWEYIGQHDSFGINFSFLLDFTPTFHSMEDGKIRWYRRFMEERLQSRRKRLSETVWFISERHLTRFIHPRLTPLFFPENPICCIYKYPKPIILNENRPFRKEDFIKNSIVYRGSLSVVLYLIDKLVYKNIVLLGIDLNTPEHFFYNMEEMKPYVEYQRKRHDKDKYQYMLTKPGKYRPFDEYLYEVNDLYFKPKGVNLFVGSTESILADRIPVYKFPVVDMKS